MQNDRKIIGEYSKGMRKRIAMAASLIHHPELFLMDEPFEGVDAMGARLMKDILMDQVTARRHHFPHQPCAGSGGAALRPCCDHRPGKIVTSGTLEELRAGGESLEDAFVRVVGAGHPRERLEWL